MSVLIVRSVPLSKAVRESWRSAGAKFLKRNAHQDKLNKLAAKADAVLNLGNLEFDFDELDAPVFNYPGDVRAISHPSALRRNLGDFIPPHPEKGDWYWVKRGGFGGLGTELYTNWPGTKDPAEIRFGDIQKHVEGEEFRVITVGDVVVQATRKLNPRWVNGKHQFDFEWVGVEGIKSNGIIPLLKKAINSMEWDGCTVIGWDVIVGPEGAFILEGNFSPGVNEATASRIVEQMRRSL